MENKNLTELHIGNLIKKYVKEKRIVQAAWARNMSVDDRTVVRYFKRATMDTKRLLIISQTLKYNFFRHIADLLPPDYPPGGSMQSQIDALKKENEDLKKEITVLKDVLKRS
jgi:hypothetical protein